MNSPTYRRQGSGPPFVYLAGIEGTGLNFYKQADDLARDHTIITFPHRPEGRYRLEQLVEDTERVMRENGVGRAGGEPATILGESFGGVLALALALARPEMIDRMILVNTFPYFEQRAKIKYGVLAYSYFPYRWVKAYRVRRAGHELFGPDVAEEDRQIFLRNTAVVPREGYISRLRIIREVDFRPELDKISVPTLVVAGTCDRLLDSVGSAQLMAARLPRARLKLLDGTGHTALISARVRVRDWLAEFATI
jgi:pimeloyl-ACP methyl ester carboxylesterase